jgi:parallel beta-helix repeat protein
VEGSDFNVVCTGSSVTHNGTTNGTSYGILLRNADNITLTNCTGTGFDYGIYLLNTNDSRIVNANASGNNIDGAVLDDSDGNLVDPSFFCNNAAGNGLTLTTGSNNNTVMDSVFCNNSDTGLLIDSDLNNITNNTAYNNTFNGFHLGGANNTLANNTAYENGDAGSFDSGFLVECCSAEDNVLFNNTAHSNNGSGFHQYYSLGNIFANNTAYNNSEHGIFVEGDPVTLNDNTAHNNSINGFYLLDGFGSSNLTGNTAYDNSQHGFHLDFSDDSTLTGNTAYGNAFSGIKIEFGDNTAISGGHLYNNNPDFTFESISLSTVNLSAVVFDNPAGNFANYTNISINASNDDDVLTLNWSAQPAALPGSYTSFANKHLNITGGSLVSLDSAVWHWLDSEPGAANEAAFGLWKYNGTWNFVPATLDTGANTLTVTSLSGPFSVFSILLNAACPAPVTVPGSYVLNNSVVGSPNPVFGGFACIAITASNVTFDCMGFSVTGNDSGSLNFGAHINGENVTLRNCVISNYTNAGVVVFDASNNFLINNTVFNNTNFSSGFLLTGFFNTSNNNYFENNTAFGNAVSGFHLIFSSSHNYLVNNTAYGGHPFAGFLSGNGTNNTFINNTAYVNSGPGFYLASATNGTLNNNTAYNNTHGFRVEGAAATGNSLTDNLAYNNTAHGFSISSSSGNAFTSNNASFNAADGFNTAVSTNTFTLNNANNNSLNGFSVGSPGGNTFTDNSAFGNVDNGFELLFGSDGNVFSGDMAFENADDGFELGVSTGNTFTDVSGSSNGVDGMELLPGADNNVIDPSVFCNNGGNGMTIDSSSNVLVEDSIFCSNGVAGIFLSSVDDSTFDNNTVFNNTGDGIFAQSDSEGNTFTGNAIFGHTLNNGLYLLPGTGSSTVFNNTAYGNFFGFYLWGDNDNVTSNIVINNLGRGIVVHGAQNITLSNNTATNNTQGIRLENGVSGASVTSNRANNNTDSGIILVSSSANALGNNDASGNAFYGIGAGISSDNNNFISNNATFNGLHGFYLENSDGNTIDPSFFCNNGGDGILNNNSNNTIIMDSTACNNTGSGMHIIGSTNVTLDNNTAFGNAGFLGGAGFFLETTGSSTLSGNLAYGQLSGPAGYTLLSSNGNTLSDNLATNNTYGFLLFNSSSNDLDGNNGTANVFFGFGLTSGSSFNNVSNSNGSGQLDGMVILGANNNIVDPSFFCGNFDNGIEMSGSNNTIIMDTTLCNNGGDGIFILNSTNTSLLSNHFYNNSPDFNVSGTGITYSMSANIFDNPTGNFSNYTNISVNDTVASSYSMDHTVQPAPILPLRRSFEAKFISISNESGAVAVDSGIWHWLDSELSLGVPPYVEPNLQLFLYNGTSWNPVNTSGPDTAANTLSGSSLSEFGVYALLEFLPDGDDDEGGGGPSEGLELDINPLCNGFVLSVKDSEGDPVENAFVEGTDDTHGSEFTPRYTDSEGKAYFTSCDIDITLSATKSGEDGDLSDFAACGICEECSTNEQCPDTEQCVFGFCEPVPCSCGAVQNHSCNAYQCCSNADCPSGQICESNICSPQYECDLNGPGPEDDNSDCENTEYCEVPPGQPGGSCKDVTGQCGFASNHAWLQYECGTELGCPACPEGQQCVDHECVANDLECPPDGIVGTQSTCRATAEGQPCALCDLLITGPDGRTFTGKTGPDGSFSLPLQLSGIYKVALLDAGGNVTKITQIKAQSAGAPEDGEPPSSTSTDPFSLLWLLVLLLLIIFGIIYWRRRGGKK